MFPRARVTGVSIFSLKCQRSRLSDNKSPKPQEDDTHLAPDASSLCFAHVLACSKQ